MNSQSIADDKSEAKKIRDAFWEFQRLSQPTPQAGGVLPMSQQAAFEGVVKQLLREARGYYGRSANGNQCEVSSQGPDGGYTVPQGDIGVHRALVQASGIPGRVTLEISNAPTSPEGYGHIFNVPPAG